MPDEDIVTMEHISDTPIQDFLNEFKAGVDAEREG